MRTDFVESVLRSLLEDDVIHQADSILTVCAGPAEHELFVRLGLTNAVISNVDEPLAEDRFAPLSWSRQDATNLSFEEASFDFAFVADGLHHTSAPHRALLELYRVARRGIIVVESRDSLVMRAANRLGFAAEHEVVAVIDNAFVSGGLNNTEVPNYVYRWTEAEFSKTIRSFNPIGRHTFRFFYALNLPYSRTQLEGDRVRLRALELAEPVLDIVTRLFKKQCNTFAMVALKPRVPDDLWPWLALDDGRVRFNRSYRPHRFRLRR